MFRTFVFLIFLLLTGCATKRPDVTKEDWKVRDFNGKSKGDVVEAAREVIRLSDPSDVKFENTEEGFNASRVSTGYYVVKTNIDGYSFKFIAQEKNGLTRTRIEIEETEIKQSVLTLGLPTGEVGKPNYPYIYELFYARLEYLLGIKDGWVKCDEAVSRVSAKFGLPNDARKIGMASLCGDYADDNEPTSTSKKIDLF